MRIELRKNNYLWIWLLIPLVVFAEIFQQWRIPRQEPSEEDWQAAVRAVEKEKSVDDLVVIAPQWAVQGRIYFKSLMDWKDFGRMDTSVYRRIIEVSMMGETAPETAHLSAVSVERYGKLTVSIFELPTTDNVLYDFTDHLDDASLSKNVQKTPSIVIDHWFTPRRAASMRLKTKASLTFKDVPLDGILYGYGFIGYFEARFDDGDPAVLSIFVNNKRIGEEVIGNFDPLRPFHYTLNEKGTGTVRFEVTAPNNGKRQFGLQADIRRPGGDR